MKNAFRIARWIASISVLAPVASLSQSTDNGDVRINEETYFTAVGEQSYPSVASSSSGFSVAWMDGISSPHNDVMLRLYDERGEPLGECLRLNDDTTAQLSLPMPRVARQYPYPAIGGTPFGNSVVVWSDERAGSPDIYCQVVRDDGHMIDANVRVNDDAPDGSQSYPDVAMWPSPDAFASPFVVVWTDSRSGDDDIYLRRFGRTSDGSAVASGPSIRVNDDYTGIPTHQGPARVAIDPLGNVVVVWRDSRSGVSKAYGQIFAPDGSRRGVNFALDSLSVPTVTPDVMMADDGSFAVAFVAGTWGDRDIVMQRFASDGAPLGDTVRVNADTSGSHCFPEIASMVGRDAFGQGYAIAWERQDTIGIEGAIHYRTVDGRGQPSSPDQTLPGGTGRGESFAALASVGYGNVNPPPDRTFLVWQQNNGYDHDIVAHTLEQYAPTGARFVVSSCRGGAEQIRPAVDARADGRSIAVWEDMRDGLRHIYGRRFDRRTPISGDFAIDGGSAWTQSDPDVAMFPDGGFVAAWTEWLAYTQTVRVRRFDSLGAPLGAAFDLAAGAGGEQREPAIVAAPDGSFAIVSTDTRDHASGDIRLQRFAPDGSPFGPSVVVNSDTMPIGRRAPAIARRADGALIVAWTEGDRGRDPSIMMQAFDAAGAMLGSNARVDGDGDSTVQALPAVAFIDDGLALIAWMDLRDDPVHADIRARLVAGLAPTGGDFRINDLSGSASRFWPEHPHPPSVAAAAAIGPDAPGGFVVAWTDYRNGDADAYAQRVDATGALRLANRSLSAGAPGTAQTFVDIAPATSAGETFCAWSDDREQRSEGWSVWGRVVALDRAVTAAAPGAQGDDAAGDELRIVDTDRPAAIVRLGGSGGATVRLHAIDGRMLAETSLDGRQGPATFVWQLPQVPSGAYVIELVTDRGVRSRALTIAR
jgi:hypothetical protein